jgi:hypothetical protein
MSRVQKSWLLLVNAVLLLAVEPSWKNKPISAWTEEEARQILDDSPWAKTVKATIHRLQTEDERRDAGVMGQGHGVGFDGVDGKNAKQKFPSDLKSEIAGPSARSKSQPVTLRIRWESALPVRAAEMKSHEMEPPTSPGDGYRVAVYGVPGAFTGDPKRLGDPLKKQAVLRREGRQDVKPSRVEVFQREDGLVVVYLFPLSAEISKKDGRIVFEAVIGRVGLAQAFNIDEMEFQGKLEL